LPNQPNPGSPSGPPAIEDLVALFFDDPQQLGEVNECEAEQMPWRYADLLAHEGHMTETVEKLFDGPVDVRVIDRRFDQPYYAREITLHRQEDGQIVQYGIVRLDVTFLDDEVCEEILAETSPLGRVLIQHNVMREVQLSALWEIHIGTRLAELFHSPPGTKTFGRTAMIYLDGEPVIELLEIIVPHTIRIEFGQSA
jgi:chorismate-pyruvate lyase